MSTHDEQPTVIIEKDSGSEIGAFLIGAIVGAGLALLFAPQTGQETQEQIRERARRLRDVTEDRVKELRSVTEERVRGLKEDMGTQLESVKGVVEQGKRAASDARADLEDRLARGKAAYRAGVETGSGAAEIADDS